MQVGGGGVGRAAAAADEVRRRGHGDLVAVLAGAEPAEGFVEPLAAAVGVGVVPAVAEGGVWGAGEGVGDGVVGAVVGGEGGNAVLLACAAWRGRCWGRRGVWGGKCAVMESAGAGSRSSFSSGDGCMQREEM